jgi:ribonuclease PH
VAAVAAAAAALADAGIDMIDIPGAACVSGQSNANESRLLVDPTATELADSAFAATAVYLPRQEVLSFSSFVGDVSSATYSELTALALDASTTVAEAVRAALREKLQGGAARAQ